MNGDLKAGDDSKPAGHHYPTMDGHLSATVQLITVGCACWKYLAVRKVLNHTTRHQLPLQLVDNEKWAFEEDRMSRQNSDLSAQTAGCRYIPHHILLFAQREMAEGIRGWSDDDLMFNCPSFGVCLSLPGLAFDSIPVLLLMVVYGLKQSDFVDH